MSDAAVKAYPYLAAVVLDDDSEVILDLEEHGWAEPTRLARVRQFSLVPKNDDVSLPVVCVHIPAGAKPVFKSRAFGVISTSTSSPGVLEPWFRCYAVGYKQGKSEVLTWVLPNGSIEIGPDPTYADHIFNTLKAQVKAAIAAQTEVPAAT